MSSHAPLSFTAEGDTSILMSCRPSWLPNPCQMAFSTAGCMSKDGTGMFSHARSAQHTSHCTTRPKRISSSFTHCSRVSNSAPSGCVLTPFFTPVGLPQLDKAGKNVFRFVNSAFSPEPLDRRQGVEHEVRAEVKFQRFLPYHISGTVNGLTLGRKRRMGVQPLMSFQPFRGLRHLVHTVVDLDAGYDPPANGKSTCPCGQPNDQRLRPCHERKLGRGVRTSVLFCPQMDERGFTLHR